MPTPSLCGANPSPFTGGGAGPLRFATNPSTAKRPCSDTSYLLGLNSETDPKSYWVQQFAAAAAAQEKPSIDALITRIAGFLAEIQANYHAQMDKLRSAIEYPESSGRRTHQGLNRLETGMRSLHQESPSPTPKPALLAEADPPQRHHTSWLQNLLPHLRSPSGGRLLARRIRRLPHLPPRRRHILSHPPPPPLLLPRPPARKSS